MNARTFATTLTALLALFATAVAMPAAAQDGEIDPETGEVYVPPANDPPQNTQDGAAPWYAGGPTGQTPPPERPPSHIQDERPSSNQQTTNSSSTSSSTSSNSTDSDGEDNHMSVVGRIGVGFVGINDVPIGDNSGGGLGAAQISAPTIGVRYWFGETIGLDVGIGIGYAGGNLSSGTTTIPTDDGFAMTIHAGVPIALFHDTHYTFELIPELNLGFATGTAYGAMSDDDLGRSGFIFSVGARAGAEIQFGFIGIPNLSLLATVGLQFRYTSAGIGSNRSGSIQGGSANGFSFGTSLQGEPWDIFLGSLSAFYYFG